MTSGQGYETTFAQAAAEGLGVAPEIMRVMIGNTDTSPYGMGARGSRGAAAGGGVAYLAGRRLQEKVLAIAAHLLSLNSSDGLRLRDGTVERLVGGAFTATELTLADIARTAFLDPLRLPDGMAPGLHVTMSYDPPPMTYSNSTHLCAVAVDRATGMVRLERYLAAHDSGTAINPKIVEGQLHGAIAMGLSGALFEELVYDGQGQFLSGSLADYLIADRDRAAGLRADRARDAGQADAARHQGDGGRRRDGRHRRRLQCRCRRSRSIGRDARPPATIPATAAAADGEGGRSIAESNAR